MLRGIVFAKMTVYGTRRILMTVECMMILLSAMVVLDGYIFRKA